MVAQVHSDRLDMTKIVNPPKDSLKLLAENVGQFEQLRDNWQREGNLLYADFQNGTYQAAAIFSGKVVLLQYTLPEEKEIVEAPSEPSESDSSAVTD